MPETSTATPALQRCPSPGAHSPGAHGPAAHGPGAHGPAAHGLGAHGPGAHGPLADWFERAGVRKDPHRLAVAPAAPGEDASAGHTPGGTDAVPGASGGGIGQELRDGKIFFPRSLMPYLAHPLVQALPPERLRTLAARHLYQYLAFTAHFETQVVNRAAARIATGGTHASLPASARIDALKIYTDEGWHALYSLDLVAQLAAATGIPPLPYDFGPYLARLDAVGDDLLPGRPVLAQMLQVVVFETLVTSILSAVPADRSVLTVIRETVADHARDEGRHHAYFAAFFRELWAGLDLAERMAAARCLPQLIQRSLEPDHTPAGAALLSAGLSPHQAGTVLAESYPKDRQSAEIAWNARHSVRLFRDCGVLDVPGGREAFGSAGLLGDRGPAPSRAADAPAGGVPPSCPYGQAGGPSHDQPHRSEDL